MDQDQQIQFPQEPEPSSGRLIMTLGVAGFFSGLVLVSVFLFTRPMIAANQLEDLQEAIYQVLPGCTSYKTFQLVDGRLVPAGESGEQVEAEDLPETYAGYDESGALIGFAITSEEPGYQDVIKGIFGYDPEQKQIIGFQVLESKETPGLGDKIIKDKDFQENFKALSVEPEILAVKEGEKQQPNEVDAITGATISSKAVVRLLQKGVDKWKEPIEAYMKQQ